MIYRYLKVHPDRISIQDSKGFEVGTFITYYDNWLFRASDNIAHSVFMIPELEEILEQLKKMGQPIEDRTIGY